MTLAEKRIAKAIAGFIVFLIITIITKIFYALKKRNKSNQENIDYFFEDEWEFEKQEHGYWTFLNLENSMSKLRYENENLINLNYFEFSNFNEKKEFKILNYSDDYDKYIFTSSLRSIELKIAEEYSLLTAMVIVLSLLKFSYYAGSMINTHLANFTVKEKIDETFVDLIAQFNKIMIEYLEIITNVGLKQFESYVTINPITDHEIIEEAIDYGSEFINDLSYQTLNLFMEYGFIIEKAIENLNDIKEALNYFNLTEDDDYDLFKKNYREASLKYHPDLNPDNKINSEKEMERINSYKEILERYFSEKKD